MDQEQLLQLPLLNVPYLVRSDPAMRDHMLMLGASAALVLTRHGLSRCNLEARYAADPDAFVIRLEDLTPSGLEFAKSGFPRWLGNTDRWARGASLDKFVQALERQVSRSARKAL